MEVDAIVKCLSFAAMAAIAYMLYYHHQTMKRFEEQIENEDEEIFASSIPQPSKRQKTENFPESSQNFASQSHNLLFGAPIQEESSSYQPLITIPARHEVCVGTEDDIEIIESAKPQKRSRNFEKSNNSTQVERKPIPFAQNGVKEKSLHYDVNFHKDRREAFYAKLRERPNSPVKRFVLDESKKKGNEGVYIVGQKPEQEFLSEIGREKITKMKEEFRNAYKEAQDAPKIVEPVKKAEETKVNFAGDVREVPKPDFGNIKSKEEIKTVPSSQEVSQKSSFFSLTKQSPEIVQKSQEAQKHSFPIETLQKSSETSQKPFVSETTQKFPSFGSETLIKASISAPVSSFFTSPSQAALFSAPQKTDSDTSKETQEKSKSSSEPPKPAQSDTGLKFLFSSSATTSIQMPKPPADLTKKQEESKISSSNTQPIQNVPPPTNTIKTEESKQNENKPNFQSPLGSVLNPFKQAENSAQSLFGGSTIFGSKTETLANPQKSAESSSGVKLGDSSNLSSVKEHTTIQNQPYLFTNKLGSLSQPLTFTNPFKSVSEIKNPLSSNENKDTDEKKTQLTYPELPKPSSPSPQSLFAGLTPTSSLFNVKPTDKSSFQSLSSQSSFFGVPNLTPLPDSSKSQTPPTSADQKPQTPPTSSLFGSKFPFSNPSAFNPNSSMSNK